MMPCISCGRARLMAKVRIPKNAANVRKAVDKRLPKLVKKISKRLRSIGAAAALSVALPDAMKMAKRSTSEILADIKLNGFAALVDSDITPELIAAFNAAGINAVEIVSATPDDAMTSTISRRAVAHADVHGGDLVTSLEDSTRDMLRVTLSRATEEGWGVGELAAAMRDNYAFSDARAETIARTELAFSHMQGTMAGWQESGVVVGKRSILADTHPQYDECDDAAAQGVIGLDETFSDGSDGPPYHPNCFLPGTEVAAIGVTAHLSRRFEGEVIGISVAGKRLSCTPNHPILTQRGWIAAGRLEVGDGLFECIDPADAVMALNPDDHQMPTMIEQIAAALLMRGGFAGGSVPTAAVDFHGDGIANGHVDIVRAAGALGDGLDALIDEQGAHESFVTAAASGVGIGLDNSGPLAELFERDFRPAPRGVSVFSEGLDSVGGLPGIPDAHSVALFPHGQVEPAESVTQRGAMASDLSGQPHGALPAQVTLMDVADFIVRESAVMASDAAGFMRVTKIDSLRRYFFSGHVFNLSTQGGWYFAGGILAHNCLCDLSPVLEGEDDAPETKKMVMISEILGGLRR